MSARQGRKEGPNGLSSQADVVGGRPVGGGRAERSPHWTLAIPAAHCLGSEGGSQQVCVWCVRLWRPPRACPDTCSPTSPYCPRQRQASRFLGGAGPGCHAEPQGAPRKPSACPI